MPGPASSAVQLWDNIGNFLSTVATPITELVKLLAWPLTALLDLVDGDPAALRAKAAWWDAQATSLRTFVANHRRDRQANVEGWKGSAGPAYNKQMATAEQALLGVADEYNQTANYLRQVADALQFTHDFITALIIELVSFAVITLITGLALSAVTYGASWVASQIASLLRAAHTAIESIRALGVCVRFLSTIMRLLSAAIPRIGKVASHLNRLATRQKGIATGRTAILKKNSKRMEKYQKERREFTAEDFRPSPAAKAWHAAWGTRKLGRKSTPFDMTLLQRISVLKERGVRSGGVDIMKDWARNLKWNLPNSVLHGGTAATATMVVSPSNPADVVVGKAVDSGAKWLDENLFGSKSENGR